MGSNQPWGWIKVIYHRDCTIYSNLDIFNKYFFLCQVFTANHFFSIVIDNELTNDQSKDFFYYTERNGRGANRRRQTATTC